MDAKTLCLGALILGDASGYEIRRLYEEGAFACFHAISYGSIYPALNALRAEGFVTATEHTQEGRPDKKVYAITESGLRAFAERLQGPPAPDSYRSDVMFILSFAHLLAPDMRRRLLDAYRTEYSSMLDALRECDAADGDGAPGQRFVRGLGCTVYEAVIRYIDTNRHLIEEPRTAGAPTTEEQGT